MRRWPKPQPSTRVTRHMRSPCYYASPRNGVILTRVMPARVKPVANPFRFGRIVSGEAFTDREADLMVLERELRDGQNILLEAPRRFGKTSLILEVKRRLQASGIPVASLDCMLVPSDRARVARRAEHPARGAAPVWQDVAHPGGKAALAGVGHPGRLSRLHARPLACPARRPPGIGLPRRLQESGAARRRLGGAAPEGVPRAAHADARYRWPRVALLRSGQRRRAQPGHP